MAPERPTLAINQPAIFERLRRDIRCLAALSSSVGLGAFCEESH